MDRVLVLRVNEAAAPNPDAANNAAERSARALEWTKAFGMPLATVLVTLAGGYYFTTLTKDREARETSLIKEREARESSERLYAQLLTQREQSDALIRKDMFGVVIKEFLTGVKAGDWNNKVLQLELLASNFNQSLDLAPLFKDLARQLARGAGLTPAKNTELRKRLDLTAANLIFRQVDSLARHGYAEGQQVRVAEWEKLFGKPIIEATIPRSRVVPAIAGVPPDTTGQIHFAVEVIDISTERREVEVRLRVNFPGNASRSVDRNFWVSQYDFPMLDNTQLPDGLRASVVMTEFFVPEGGANPEANSFVMLHLVVFPAASASFKERQDYDDILLDMLRAKSNQSRREGKQP